MMAISEHLADMAEKMTACLEKMKVETDADQEEMKAGKEVMETYLEERGVSH
jgi:hypothetical protein